MQKATGSRNSHTLKYGYSKLYSTPPVAAIKLLTRDCSVARTTLTCRVSSRLFRYEILFPLYFKFLLCLPSFMQFPLFFILHGKRTFENYYAFKHCFHFIGHSSISMLFGGSARADVCLVVTRVQENFESESKLHLESTRDGLILGDNCISPRELYANFCRILVRKQQINATGGNNPPALIFDRSGKLRLSGVENFPRVSATATWIKRDRRKHSSTPTYMSVHVTSMLRIFDFT